MNSDEFSRRFYKPCMPQLDSDMIPVLVAFEGVYSPGTGEECLEFETRDAAIAYWVDRGYKVFVLSENSKSRKTRPN